MNTSSNTFRTILNFLVLVIMWTFGLLCQAQTFDFVGLTGSTGVGFNIIYASTKLSESKIAFFEYPNTILMYDVDKKLFTREPIPYFSKHDYSVDGMVYTRGQFVFLLHDRNDNNCTRLVCIDKKRNLINDYKLSIKQTSRGGTRFVLLNDRTVRYISSTGFEDVNIYSGNQTSTPKVFPGEIQDYKTDNGKHYVSTETGVFELLVDGTSSVISM